MSDDLKTLIEEQEQLRAMKKSCVEFEQRLNEKIGKYIEKNLGYKEGESFSILDILSKVSA